MASWRAWRFWTDQLSDYPEQPVVLWRRGVFATFAALLWLSVLYFGLEVVSAPSADGMSGSDAWQVWFFAALFGACAIYGGCRVVVFDDHVIVLNPMRKVVVPLVAVTGIEHGWHLGIVTRSSTIRAWAVEARNTELVTQEFQGQEDFAAFLTAQAQRNGSGADDKPIEERGRFPDAVTLIPVGLLICIGLVLALNDGPLGLS